MPSFQLFMGHLICRIAELERKIGTPEFTQDTATALTYAKAIRSMIEGMPPGGPYFEYMWKHLAWQIGPCMVEEGEGFQTKARPAV